MTKHFWQLMTPAFLLAMCLSCEGAIVVNGGINFIFFGKSVRDRVITSLNYNFSSLIGTRFFNVNQPTFVYVHGFNTIYTVLPDSDIFRAYIKRGGFNVVALDWSFYALNNRYLDTVASISDQVAFINRMLMQMRAAGFNLSAFHFAGVSLGVQMAGEIGRQLIANYGFTLTRITGLDPAIIPFWNSTSFLRKSDTIFPTLTKRHAKFVDIIHSNAGFWGLNYPTGHMDFWVNGGKWQYKCSLHYNSSQFCDSRLDNCLFCSHARSLKYYIESVNKPVTNQGFIGRKCPGTIYTSEVCTGPRVSMGFYADLYRANPGNYFVATKTNGIPPYSLT